MAKEDIAWALNEISSRREAYMLRRNYYRGDHRLLFATKKFENTFGEMFRTFADNLCPAVVDPLVDRLQIKGFQTVEEADAPEFEELWRDARLKRQAGYIHQGACSEADSYLIVWPNANGEPQFWAQDPTEIAVEYSKEESDVMVKAAKLWRVAAYSTNTKAVWRLNLYYPDYIEKWKTERSSADFPTANKGWETYEAEGEDEGALVNPYGRVPVFHFANNAPIGRMGRSELDDVIPIQDALNKSVADMLVTMEFSAFPQRWATGVQVQKEVDPETGQPTGRPKNNQPPFDAGVDRIMAVMSKDARFGQFDSADLRQFVAVQDSLRGEFARITGTPLHYFMPDGNAPSGEALKTSEARLVKKAEDRADAFGQTWSDALGFAMQLKRNASDPIPVKPLWETFESRDRKYEAEIAEIKVRLGISNRQALREMGYTEEQIEQFADEREADQGTFGEAMLTAFEQGQPISGARANAIREAEAGS